MIPWPAHSSKENYNIEGNLGRFQNHLQKPSCQNCIPKNQISLIKKFLCHGELLRALSFSFLLQAIVFAIFASLEQLPRFVSSLPSAGHVNDRHLANEWQTSKWNQRIVAGVTELGFWLTPVVELAREESMQLQLHFEKHFTLLERKS